MMHKLYIVINLNKGKEKRMKNEQILGQLKRKKKKTHTHTYTDRNMK